MAPESAHMDQREHLTYRLQASLQQAPITIISLPLFPSGAQLELDSMIPVGPFPLRTFSLYDTVRVSKPLITVLIQEWMSLV